MCGNFGFSKNCLVALNLCYMIVSFILIGVATYGKTSAYVDSLPIIGGIAACGAFLLLISIVGLIGTLRHHQATLFFYMCVVLLIFVIQFSVACAALSVNDDQQMNIAQESWNLADNSTKLTAEKAFGCCGYTNATSEAVECDQVPSCTPDATGQFTCPTCVTTIRNKIDYAFKAAGGVGIFFSFTELVAVACTIRFRSLVRSVTI